MNCRPCNRVSHHSRRFFLLRINLIALFSPVLYRHLNEDSGFMNGWSVVERGLEAGLLDKAVGHCYSAAA